MAITISSLGEPTAEYFTGGLCPVTGADLKAKYGKRWRRHAKKLEVPVLLPNLDHTILVMHIDQEVYDDVVESADIQQWIVDSYMAYSGKQGWQYDPLVDVNLLKGKV